MNDPKLMHLRYAMASVIAVEFGCDADQWGWAPAHTHDVFWVAADHAARAVLDTIRAEQDRGNLGS